MVFKISSSVWKRRTKQVYRKSPTKVGDGTSLICKNGLVESFGLCIELRDYVFRLQTTVASLPPIVLRYYYSKNITHYYTTNLQKCSIRFDIKKKIIFVALLIFAKSNTY